MLGDILIPVLILGALGIIFGLMLGFASKIFKVERDERIDQIIEVLPGANCGGCGFAGCSDFATHVCGGNAKVNGCPVGGKDVADKVAEIMGAETGDFVKCSARVLCNGSNDVAKDKYDYDGLMDCFAAEKMGYGHKECSYGCLGYGTCVKACKFGAISVKNGVAVVDKEKCTACGQCVEACPKHIIQIVPDDKKYSILCSNKDRGPVCKTACDVSCIGCKICEKNCESGAIIIESFLSHIDYDKCVGCGICMEKCPRKAIKEV